MNRVGTAGSVSPEVEPRLSDTRDAFDSVADDYDGERGNNALIQDMRGEMWRWLDATFAPNSCLLDLGCGTGLDAVRMAQLGHSITATDWSPRMVERTVERAARAGVLARVQTLAVGAHELHRVSAANSYDGGYSNLGPLNCVPNLADVSLECARLVKPGGLFVFTVIGRLCPWELVHYARRRRWRRATVRFAHGAVPVSMNKHTIWTRYYTPREFYAAFQEQFTLEHFRALCVLVPPPYLTWIHERHPRWHERLWRMERRVGGWPLLRTMGDHFLIVMKKR